MIRKCRTGVLLATRPLFVFQCFPFVFPAKAAKMPQMFPG